MRTLAADAVMTGSDVPAEPVPSGVANAIASTDAMHIAIAGPIATADVARLLDEPEAPWPLGYPGAPFLATLIAALIARGHRVSAFTLSNDMPLDEGGGIVACGRRFALHHLPMRPRAWPFNGRRVGRIVDLYAFERRGLECAIRAAAPDVVHAHWAYEFAWSALDSGVPHVVTCHDSPARIARLSTGATRRGYRWLRAAMAHRVLARARQVTTVSPYMRAQMQPWCRVPVAVVPNPIDVDAAGAGRVAVAGRARICMVGNGWSDFKNPRAALLAFDRLSRSRHDVELVACGDDFEPGGVAETWWRSQALAGRVVFRGRLGHEQVLSLMAESDVLLHPSLEESFGVVVAEAMAIGLPVVGGSASGAVPWVLGDAGWLVDVSRPDEIVAALAVALGDGAESKRRGHAGRDRVRTHFAADVVARQYESHYTQARIGQAEAVAA